MSTTVKTPVTFHAVEQQAGTHGALPNIDVCSIRSAALILLKTSSPTLLSMFIAALETNNTIGKHVEAHPNTRDSGFWTCKLTRLGFLPRDAQ